MSDPQLSRHSPDFAGSEPARRRFFAMQLPSCSAGDLYDTAAALPLARRFSATELNAAELVRRLMLIQQPPEMPRGVFGEKWRRYSDKSPARRRTYECSVFEVVDLGPVSEDKASTHSLGPAAVHRVSVRRKCVDPNRNESKRQNSGLNSGQDAPGAGQWKRSPGQGLLCCCVPGTIDSDTELDGPRMKRFNEEPKNSDQSSPDSGMFKQAKRRLSKLSVKFLFCDYVAL